MHICKSWIANPTFTLKLLLYYRALIYCPLPLIFTAINYYFWHPQITPLPLFFYISNNPVAKGKGTKRKFQTIFKPPTPLTNKNRSIWGLCEKKGDKEKKEKKSPSPRIDDIQHQYINCPTSRQFIHHGRNAFTLNRCANCHPALFLQRVNSWGRFPWCNSGRF